MEDISLKGNIYYFDSVLDCYPVMGQEKRNRYSRKLLFVWGIPVACGIFSFVYWFLFVPLLWSILPHQTWPLLWFSLYALAAFAAWLAIITACLLWWHHKRTTVIKMPDSANTCSDDRSSKGSSNDSGFKDSPRYNIQVSAVQPDTETPPASLYRAHTRSSVCIQVQPQTTPSLYNARTGRESFEAGYQLDGSEPTSSSVSIQSVIPKAQNSSKQNSEVTLLKKKNSLKVNDETDKFISSSDSEGSSDLKDMQEEGDAMNKLDIEKKSDLDDDKGDDMHQATADKTNELLNRDESFKGLPEMKSFGQYLQLVTVESPVSPREIFFSDLATNKDTDENEVHMRSARNRKSYCIGDLAAAQQRISEARKSMPVLLYASDTKDIESGLVLDNESVPSPTKSIPTVLEIVDESPSASPKENALGHHYFELKSHDPVVEATMIPVKTSVVRNEGTFSSSSSSSGKFFVADVLRTESITSEAYLIIDGDDHSTRACKLSKWETKRNGSLSKVPITEENTNEQEGRWVLLSRDYAANILEAFIRVESEAMERERTPGKFHDDDTDNDSVFLEMD